MTRYPVPGSAKQNKNKYRVRITAALRRWNAAAATDKPYSRQRQGPTTPADNARALSRLRSRPWLQGPWQVTAPDKTPGDPCHAQVRRRLRPLPRAPGVEPVDGSRRGGTRTNPKAPRRGSSGPCEKQSSRTAVSQRSSFACTLSAWLSAAVFTSQQVVYWRRWKLRSRRLCRPRSFLHLFAERLLRS